MKYMKFSTCWAMNEYCSSDVVDVTQTDSTDLHAVGCLLHLLPEVVGLRSCRLHVAGQS